MPAPLNKIRVSIFAESKINPANPPLKKKSDQLSHLQEKILPQLFGPLPWCRAWMISGQPLNCRRPNLIKLTCLRWGYWGIPAIPENPISGDQNPIFKRESPAIEKCFQFQIIKIPISQFQVIKIQISRPNPKIPIWLKPPFSWYGQLL